MKQAFSETDMYLPIKEFFQSLGYAVYAEVKNCDVTLLKDNKLIVIELKKSFNLQLVFQAIERQKVCDEVYVAIPRLKRYKGSQYNNIINMVKRLGIGLITIAMDSPVKTIEILVFPEAISDIKRPVSNIKKKEPIINEISLRTHDLNLGGSNKRKLMTAYREKAIKIACVLEAKGALKASELINIFDCDKNAYNILRLNAYGWFEAAGKAKFALSDAGIKALKDKEFSQLFEYYRKWVENEPDINKA